MLLPANFASTIADTFYDKEVSILVKTTSSTDGWIEETGTVSSTFKANVRFDNLATIQSELGLTESIDVALTCATDVPLQIDELFSYKGVTYKVAACVPYDSHQRIVGNKWQ